MSNNTITQSTLNITATATRELQNDVLSIYFTSSESGTEPVAVQEALRKHLADALAIVRPLLKESEVETETQGFSVQPRYSKKSEITGYYGSTGLTVKGTDTATISGLASKITTMVVTGTGNSLSRKVRKANEKEITNEAIQNFRDKAKQAADSFGFKSWLPGIINVQVDRDYGPRGGARVVAASLSLESATPMEVESGKTEINATVSGSIILAPLPVPEQQ